MSGSVPTSMFKDCSVSYVPDLKWSLIFMRKSREVILARWNSKERKFFPGEKIVEIAPRWGHPDVIHLKHTKPAEIDPDGDLDLELILTLDNLDVTVLNCDTTELLKFWKSYSHDSSDLLVKSKLHKCLVKLVKKYYEETEDNSDLRAEKGAGGDTTMSGKP